MLIALDEAKEHITGISDEELEMRLDAVELFVRSHTHNDFTNNVKRCDGPVISGRVLARSDYFRVGDTVKGRCFNRPSNDDFYTIVAMDATTITLDLELYEADNIVLTKVEYPASVVLGALDLIKYDVASIGKDADDVASETISRHSVTYKDRSAYKHGYPDNLLAFLKPYKKARF